MDANFDITSAEHVPHFKVCLQRECNSTSSETIAFIRLLSSVSASVFLQVTTM